MVPALRQGFHQMRFGETRWRTSEEKLRKVYKNNIKFWEKPSENSGQKKGKTLAAVFFIISSFVDRVNLVKGQL